MLGIIEMPPAAMSSPRSGRSPLVNRSQSAPDGNPAGRVPRPHSSYYQPTAGAAVSPRLLSPLGRTPSSGYGSTDHLTSDNNRRSDQNNNYDKNKTKSLRKWRCSMAIRHIYCRCIILHYVFVTYY